MQGCVSPLHACMDKHIVKGRDLIAPTKTLTLNGVTYQLTFNNKAARVAEDVYEDVYNRPDKGYFDILDDASKGKHRALQAIYYGALVAGGTAMSWEQFDADFRLSSIEGVEDLIMAELSKSLPPADGAAPNAAGQPPETQDDGPGAG